MLIYSLMDQPLVVKAITIILFTIAGGVSTIIGIYFKKLADHISAKTQNEKYGTIINNINDIVQAAVMATQQTFVDNLKKDGKFNSEAQKEAFNKTFNEVKAQITPELENAVNEIVKDFDKWLETQIEATIKKIKGQVINSGATLITPKKNKKKPKTKEAYNMIKEARLSEGLTIEDIATLHSVPVKQIEEQLAKGIEVEYEHTDDTSEAARIAMDHLVEIPDYYDRLEKMEKSYKTKTEAQVVHTTQEYSLEERLNDITDNIKKLEQEIADAIERNDFKTYASKVALKNDLVREKMQLKNKLAALKQLKIDRGIKEATEEGESMNKKIINENRYYSADKAYDILVEYGIATEDEINLVCSINGYNIETMEDILYVRTGYRNFDQLLGEDEDDDYFDEDEDIDEDY